MAKVNAWQIIEQYEQITGEKFQDALIRLSKLDHTGTEAAHFLGFCCKQRLDIVIKRLGYTPVVFRGKMRPGRTKSAIRARKALEKKRNAQQAAIAQEAEKTG